MERLVNVSTGDITERQLTPAEIAGAEARATAEIAAKAAEVDPDKELDARIDAVDVSGIADPAIKQAFLDIKLALKGKARGRK